MNWLIIWLIVGVITALGYVQDVQRHCALRPQGFRVVAVAVMGPVASFLLALGVQFKCDSFALAALASDKRGEP